jgi:hypothetical protein
MRVLTARRVAGYMAAVSAALIVAAGVLAYVDRDLPAGQTG